LLKVRQFQELQEAHSDNLFYTMIHYVSIVYDLDPVEVEDWDSDKLIIEFRKIKDILNVKGKAKDTITIDGTELKTIELKLLKLGQFIDIEAYINDGYTDNLHKIVALLYLKQEGGGMTRLTLESLEDINVDYRGGLIQELPIVDVLSTCENYLLFRDNFFNSYDVFNDPFEGVDLEDMDDEELKIYEEEKQKAEQSKSMQWLNFLNVLSNYDITKWDKILDTNLFLAFNQFQIIAERNKK